MNHDRIYIEFLVEIHNVSRSSRQFTRIKLPVDKSVNSPFKNCQRRDKMHERELKAPRQARR